MVMFNCNRCSAGLRKKDVENHAMRCGGVSNINVTCADCLKDFRGKEYDAHNTCVTEEQRYGGKGAAQKETGKKQNRWLGIVRQVLDKKGTLAPDVRKFLTSIQHMENIPRNKKKFQNWAFNSRHAFPNQSKLLDDVFEVLITEFNRAQEEFNNAKNNSNKSSNDTADGENEENDESKISEENGENSQEKPKKKKKKKHQEEEENGDESLNVEEEEADELTNGTSKKKSKKSLQQSEEAEPVENGQKLSKKAEKLKKKKAKYEAELMEIENYEKPEEVEEEFVEEKKTKKSKKRKLVEETNGEDEEKVEVEKKIKLDETGEEPAEDAAAASPPKKVKFDWHQMILDLVKKSKHDEVPVKKLTKKIINEYVSLYGDKGIHEKLNAKMTKKLKTCPGIRVLKEKVKLIETED